MLPAGFMQALMLAGLSGQQQQQGQQQGQGQHPH
jgi:hypothetical protein